jgi:hypothetical protein
VTTPYAAPRIGYLLTAALAGRRYDEASGLWRELDEFTQSDVIAALGAQARLAVAEAATEAGVPLRIDFTSLADPHCPESATAAQSAYEGAGPWQPPHCPRCRELVASTLAEIHFRAGVAAGMQPSYVDLICRGRATAAPADLAVTAVGQLT